MLSLVSRTAAAAVVVSVLASQPAAALNILLSNDDGFDAPGIEALASVLKKDGHTVTVVAPSGNRSGSSAAITFVPFLVEKKGARVYSVDGTPATSTMFGLAHILKTAPDLVVSGINEGANIGNATVISGTVGNAVVAITQLPEPIPAIAVSTNLVDDADPDSKANREHYEDVAEFVAKLVARLTRNGKLYGLTPGLGLNVNYPALAPNEVKGVRIAVQGRAPLFTWGFAEVGEGTFTFSASAPPDVKDVPNSDATLFREGFVTVVPIDGDYTADLADRKRIAALLKTLRP
jgi:5'/3'-nucleotidase SurE